MYRINMFSRASFRQKKNSLPAHGHIHQLIEILHKECCVQQRRIFQELLSMRALAKRCKKAQDILIKGCVERSGLRGSSSSGNLVQDSFTETKEIDAILEEMSLIHKHAELYLRFIKRRVNVGPHRMGASRKFEIQTSMKELIRVYALIFAA